MSILTITYPNTDRSLLTAAELRAAASTNSISDANLLLLGGYVSAAITKACKVPAAQYIPPTLREEGVTETFRLKSHQGYLALGRKPIVEVNTVVENDSAVDASEYEIEGSLIYKLAGNYRSCWACGLVEIDYTAGYEIVPADLKYAAIKFVQAELMNAGRDPLLKSKSIEGVSSYEWWVDPDRDTVVPPEVMRLLEDGGFVTRFGWMR